jgi:thioredoxin 1
MGAGLTELTDNSFEDAIATGVTLVDFWAPWCGPCMMQGPICERVSEKVNGKAGVAKCNVDEGRQTAVKYGIQAIPTLLVFKDGKVVQQFVGVRQEAELVSAIKSACGKGKG